MAAAERRSIQSFAGKIRRAETLRQEKYLTKSRWDSGRLNTLAAPRHRPDRVFGTARSTNANLQKTVAPIEKISKQSKPILILKKSPPNDGSKDPAKITNPETRKPVVRFQHQELPIDNNTKKIPILADGPLTPKSFIRPAKLGTPYYSAKSCSNCRFDKLEYAPYWISQIKLAESVGKHFVSAAFFRLAFECNAEPLRSLKNELKRYLSRHTSLAITDVWKELSGNHGSSDEEHNHGLINFDCAAPSVENFYPMIPSIKNSDAEESVNSIINEKGDADDTNKVIMNPCDESSKTISEHCNTSMESSDHSGDIQCAKSGDQDDIYHLTDDISSEDSSEHKKPGSGMAISSDVCLNDLHTSDDCHISSIIEEENVSKDSMNDSPSVSEKPKSTLEFKVNGVLLVEDEVDDISHNKRLKDFHASDKINISNITEEVIKPVDFINEIPSFSERSKSTDMSEVKDEAGKEEQKVNFDEEIFKIQNNSVEDSVKDFHASDGVNISSITEEAIKPVDFNNESSSSSKGPISTGGFKVKGKADRKKQKANLDKKNVKIQSGVGRTAFLSKMR